MPIHALPLGLVQGESIIIGRYVLTVCVSLSRTTYPELHVQSSPILCTLLQGRI